MIRLRTSYFAAALLAACSPVEDNREVDAPVADTTAPTIMKSTPADMARKVSVLAPLTVVFDEDVDPATVTAATVELTYANTDFPSYIASGGGSLASPRGPGMPKQLVPAAVTFDEVARTLRIVPKAPLPYGKRFTLALTGIKDVAGNELTSTIRFATAINLAVRVRPFSTTAQPQTYTTTPTDPNGFLSEYVTWNTPGIDTIWFNTDDRASQFWDQVNKPTGQLEFEWIMEEGTDTILHTPDDTKSAAFTYTYDAAGNALELVHHTNGQEGADMMFGTADDGISFIGANKYRAGGLPESFVYYYDPGLVDMAWRTADDMCGLIFEMTYDAGTHRTREVQKGCGTDGLPFNVDDQINYYVEYQYDANHAVTRLRQLGGDGVNNMWLDSDDDIDHIHVYTNDANGLVTEFRNYTGPGVNTMWENGGGDDFIETLSKYIYDANKQPLEVTSYGPGTDAKLGTPDDVIVSYQKTTYDAFGNRVRSRSFDVGPDAAPYTGDDRLLSDTDYDTMH